ncbi:MAG: hypothetical protein II502_00615, partial [Paludibacteraceae bacterium]|nr:hypothetical protein [Paludibacteraceae bacterium]
DESGEGFVYDKGNVQGYVIYNYDKPNERQHVLPYTRHYEKCVDEANNQWEFYNETVDFVFGLDWVEFQFRASDFKYEDDETYNPGECRFRLVLTW